MSNVATARSRQLRALDKAFDCDLARALSEPVRIELLLLLFRDGPSDITELSSALTQDRSVVSRHLKLLREEKLVAMTRSGRNRVYRVDAANMLRRIEGIASTLRTVVASCCPEELEAER